MEIANFRMLLNLFIRQIFTAPEVSFGFALFTVLFSLACIECCVVMATYLVERLTMAVELVSNQFMCFPSYHRKLSDLRRGTELKTFSELAQKGAVPAFLNHSKAALVISTLRGSSKVHIASKIPARAFPVLAT